MSNMGHVGRTDAETFWYVYFVFAGVCQLLTRNVQPLFSLSQLHRRQGDRSLRGTQWKGTDTTWSANPPAQGSMLVSTIPNGLFQDDISLYSTTANYNSRTGVGCIGS